MVVDIAIGNVRDYWLEIGIILIVLLKKLSISSSLIKYLFCILINAFFLLFEIS